MTNTLMVGAVGMCIGIVGAILCISLPYRALLEPSLWLAASGTMIGASSPFVGLCIWIARQFR